MQPSDWNADHVWTGPTIIDADTTYTINTDGSGSYASIPACFTDINKFMVGNSARITVNLQAGIHTISAPIEYTNKTTSRVSIVGATPIDFVSTGVSVSGSFGAYTNIITVASVDTAVVLVGMYVMVYGSTLSTNPNRIWGCHKITAVTSTTITILNKHRGAAGPSGTTGLSFKVIRSIIKTASDISGIRVISASVGLSGEPFLIDVVIEGWGASNGAETGLQVRDNAYCFLGGSITYPKVGIVAFGIGMSALQQSSISADSFSVAISDSGNLGLYAYKGSFISAGYVVVSSTRVNSAGYGVACDERSSATIGSAYLASNAINVWAYAGSQIRALSAPTVNEALTSGGAAGTTFSPTVNTAGNANAYIEG